MASFPTTRAELEAAGYSRNCYTRCKGCTKAIEFWNTPNGAHIPMEHMPDPDSPAESHFVSCPNAAQFRKEPRSQR
jgi:hypothetical protein